MLARHKRRWLHRPLQIFTSLVLLLVCSTGRAADVPAFTPNVIDPNHFLDPRKTQAVNAGLEKVRARADILGAVYLVKTLNREAIEQLAVRAFKDWKLGIKGKDNGLLLVLSMQDRQSKFEVGYGLEGDLPDAIVRRALDDVLRPRMREGLLKDAILDAFNYLAAVRTKDPSFKLMPTKSRLLRSSDFIGNGFLPFRGLFALIIYLFCLWSAKPIATELARHRAKKLQGRVPQYDWRVDPALNAKRSLGLRIFLSANPGAFVFCFGAMSLIVFFIVVAAPVIVTLLYIKAFAAKYKSNESFLDFLSKERAKHQAQVDKGFMEEIVPGQFKHTPAYFASDEYRSRRTTSDSSSSSSSSSSSDFSSSSDGGSSGGGGASSSW